MNTTGATRGAGTANPSGAPDFTSVLSGFRVSRSLVFVDRCLSFFWPLCRLSFFDSLILISPLVSSNSFSYSIIWVETTLQFVFTSDQKLLLMDISIIV
jgi:glucan phosphoethanolaminetransferase (alkaline phosphatase superfamily)